MSKLWTFGDSFTKGLGLYNDEHQYSCYIGEEKKIWTHLLSEYLVCDAEVVAFNGISNDMIWDNVIDKWDDILPGDTIIIGLTKLPRWQYYSSTHKQKGLFNKTPVRDTQLGPNEFTGKSVLHNLRENIEDVFMNTMTNFMFLTQRFEDKGCKSYLWDSSLWTKFSTIAEETEGKYKDHHWGVEGNKQMFNYVKNELGYD